ncbi:hypothetical protein L3X38_012511 [Prunus dulcis]|uniref:Uncharacterized protein n=1 Tax=Prunus dulcis TaxID=3755 RepID=A0AAD4ZG49_PRUDU|nr:hypothetical protein L3X38_012511 [Prunus dulcis]
MADSLSELTSNSDRSKPKGSATTLLSPNCYDCQASTSRLDLELPVRPHLPAVFELPGYIQQIQLKHFSSPATLQQTSSRNHHSKPDRDFPNLSAVPVVFFQAQLFWPCPGTRCPVVTSLTPNSAALFQFLARPISPSFGCLTARPQSGCDQSSKPGCNSKMPR